MSGGATSSSSGIWSDVACRVGFARKTVGLRAAQGRVLIRMPGGFVARFALADAEEFRAQFGEVLRDAQQQVPAVDVERS